MNSRGIGQKGFSLTEVMIGGAILAGVALGGAQLFKDQKNSQKGIEYTQDLSMFHQRLVKNLSLAENCNATLSELYPSAGGNITAIGDVPRISRCTSGCFDNNDSGTQHTAYSVTGRDTLIAKGAFIDNREIWQVRNIAIIPAQDSTGNPVTRSTSGPVILRMTYVYNPKLYPTNPKTLNKDIILNTRFNSVLNGGGFRECINSLESSTNNLQNDFCKTLNYDGISSTGAFTKWDESTQTCVFGHQGVGAKQCDALGLEIAGFDERGFVRCRSIVLPGESADMVAPSPVPQTCTGTQKPIINYDSVSKQVIIQCVN